jgi:hypothetical protein
MPTKAILPLLVFLACASLVSAENESVIPLTIDSGGIEANRDARIFSLPVKCNAVDAQFVWGCGAWTILSESFANKCGLDIKPDPEVADLIDSDGKPMFSGSAQTQITVGDLARTITAKVMRDTAYNKGMTGVIGCDISAHVQWEMNPDPKTPTLTIRPPGTELPQKPLAILPLKVGEDDNLYLSITIRNAEVPVMLAPQNTDLQAAPDLQKVWDIASGAKTQVKSYAGDLKTYHLTGKRDVVHLGKDIQEGDLIVVLIGDKDHPERTPNAKSAIGQSFLNRYHYCVDPHLKKLIILSRMPLPAPAKQP